MNGPTRTSSIFHETLRTHPECREHKLEQKLVEVVHSTRFDTYMKPHRTLVGNGVSAIVLIADDCNMFQTGQGEFSRDFIHSIVDGIAENGESLRIIVRQRDWRLA